MRITKKNIGDCVRCCTCGEAFIVSDDDIFDGVYQCPGCYTHNGEFEMIYDPKSQLSADEYSTLYCMIDEFAEYEGDIPAACIACGGPYPSCTISCKLFDD